MYQNTRRHVGVHLCFHDVYFLRGCFRREKVHPSFRVAPVTVPDLSWLCVFGRLVRMQMTERLVLRPVTGRFAYESFSMTSPSRTS